MSVVSVVCYAVLVAEWLLDILALPLSFLNFYLIQRTSILHINIKWLLLFQSLSIILLAGVRIPDVFYKLTSSDIHAEFDKTITTIRNFALTICGVLGVFLTIERVLATLFVAKYETYKKPYVAAVLITITVLSGLSVAKSEAIRNKTENSKITLNTATVIVSSTLLSFASLMTLIYLNYYNGVVYRRNSFQTYAHSLTHRYQLSENIRTGKQLAPCLFLHFFCNLLGEVMSFFVYFDILIDSEDNVLITSSSYAITNFFILVTVIKCHPFLNRSAFIIFKQAFCCNTKVDPDAVLNINGKVLLNANKEEANAYFDMLHQTWQ